MQGHVKSSQESASTMVMRVNVKQKVKKVPRKRLRKANTVPTFESRMEALQVPLDAHLRKGLKSNPNTRIVPSGKRIKKLQRRARNTQQLTEALAASAIQRSASGAASTAMIVEQ